MNSEFREIEIMRHAESLEDVDKTAYERVSDEEMPLTEGGRAQAYKFGQVLSKKLVEKGAQINIILSPSKRVLETAKIIVSTLPKSVRWSLKTEDLIVKQNWGDVTVKNRKQIEKERYETGVLRYQFPNGENGAQMLQRFKTFTDKLLVKIAEESNKITLLITHGFEMRVLLKCLLQWTEDYFESLAHPLNCESKKVLITDTGTPRLIDEMRQYDPVMMENFIRRIK